MIKQLKQLKDKKNRKFIIIILSVSLLLFVLITGIIAFLWPNKGLTITEEWDEFVNQ